MGWIMITPTNIDRDWVFVARRASEVSGDVIISTDPSRFLSLFYFLGQQGFRVITDNLRNLKKGLNVDHHNSRLMIIEYY
jgi:hypothetical protein